MKTTTTARRALGLIAVLVLTMAACSDSGADTTTVLLAPGTTAATPTTSAPASPTTPATSAPAAGDASFALTAVSFSEGFIEITNLGDGAGSLDGWFICQRPSYHSIGAIELAPGESTRILAAEASFGSLDSGSGEVGLYADNDFSNASVIRSYVEWGESGHGRSGTAVEAGIWTDGGFVTTDGSTGALTSDGATSPDGWSTG